MKIDVGDVVLKEKQKALSRKDGKLHNRYNTSTYTVIKIMQNGNAVLCSNKSNDILTRPYPLKYLKKFVKREYKSLTTKLTNSMTPVTDARMEPRQSKERLHFKFDPTTSITSSSTPAATGSKERMNYLEFVDNILDIISETVPQDELESLDSDDEFNVEVWSVSKAQNWPFRPLSKSSSQEVGPLVHISNFGQ